MEFLVLGPVEVWNATVPVNLGERKQRLVLAVLALESNHLVPLDRLVDILWSDHPPSSARRTVQAHMSRLRTTLARAGAEAGDVAIVRRGPGYVLNCQPYRVDAHRFRHLSEQARHTENVLERSSLLRQALALWRGPALADAATGEVCEQLCHGLHEARLAAVEDRFEAELRLGHHVALIDDLTGETARHPHRQRLVGQLMLALYRAGRVADALSLYATTRRRLGDELGLDPSAELKRLHLAILRADPAIDTVWFDHARSAFGRTVAARLHTGKIGGTTRIGTTRTGAARAATARTETGRVAAGRSSDSAPSPSSPSAAVTAAEGRLIPAQLPSDIPDFVGRAAQLLELNRLLPEHDAGNRTAVPVAVLTGGAGVGKTTLAAHWVHSIADRYPDGQLYVNLSAHGGGAPLTPMEAVRALLDGLATGAARIPDTVSSAAAVYRSRLAGRRVVIVLDDAASAEQVRLLLPGSPTCAVLVTSRHRLHGLVAREGARWVHLDTLSAEEALELLAGLCGAGKVAAEPAAAAQLARLCGRLPLALRIAAANLAGRRATLTDQAQRLALADRLGELQIEGDEDFGVPVAFGRSYTSLPAPARRLFRMLGLTPGTRLSVPAVAALAMVPPDAARRVLAQLVDANVVAEWEGDRYGMNALMRYYAADRCAEEDLPGERQAAVGRLLRWYSHGVAAALRSLQTADLCLMASGQTRPSVAADGRGERDYSGSEYLQRGKPGLGGQEAGAWLAAERVNLVALILHGKCECAPRQTLRLATQLQSVVREMLHPPGPADDQLRTEVLLDSLPHS